MPKDFIKKYMPDPNLVKNNKSLRFLGPLIHDPNLWHLNRRSVSKAFAFGLFWGCIPIPLQMLAAALCAMRFKANLPLSVAIVWFSNPLTMPPIFYAEYLLGAWILDIPASPFEYELSFHWLKGRIYEIGLPLYFGSFIMGIVLSVSGYHIIDWVWRKKIIAKWKKRIEDRTLRNQENREQ
tara:strand:- start:33092 stop:33634 length:543 start_codon:yes stop_codon:yes gene_type:complete